MHSCRARSTPGGRWDAGGWGSGGKPGGPASLPSWLSMLLSMLLSALPPPAPRLGPLPFASRLVGLLGAPTRRASPSGPPFCAAMLLLLLSLLPLWLLAR